MRRAFAWLWCVRTGVRKAAGPRTDSKLDALFSFRCVVIVVVLSLSSSCRLCLRFVWDQQFVIVVELLSSLQKWFSLTDILALVHPWNSAKKLLVIVD